MSRAQSHMLWKMQNEEETKSFLRFGERGRVCVCVCSMIKLAVVETIQFANLKQSAAVWIKTFQVATSLQKALAGLLPG